MKRQYVKARIQEHETELFEAVQSLQGLQDKFKLGEDVSNIHVKIDNLTKKVLVKRSVIAELKHILDV